jgi:hypothetical protein
MAAKSMDPGVMIRARAEEPTASATVGLSGPERVHCVNDQQGCEHEAKPLHSRSTLSPTTPPTRAPVAHDACRPN